MTAAARALAAALLATLAAGTAEAATWAVSYTSSQATLTAVFEGELQADGNTVVLSSILSAAADGVAVDGVDILVGYRDHRTGDGSLPTLTLDGSVVDLFARRSDNSAWFIFDTHGVYNGSQLFFSIGEFGSIGRGEAYDAANFGEVQASAVSDVPVPASAPLLLAGLAGVAALRRRAG